MKTSDVVLIAIFFLVIGILISDLYIKSKNTCYDLPEHGSTDQWGPKYWAAIHSIGKKIPCSICREEGQELFSFVHDYVNAKTEKPLYDSDNYNKWLNKFSEIKNKKDAQAK